MIGNLLLIYLCFVLFVAMSSPLSAELRALLAWLLAFVVFLENKAVDFEFLSDYIDHGDPVFVYDFLAAQANTYRAFESAGPEEAAFMRLQHLVHRLIGFIPTTDIACVQFVSLARLLPPCARTGLDYIKRSIASAIPAIRAGLSNAQMIACFTQLKQRAPVDIQAAVGLSSHPAAVPDHQQNPVLQIPPALAQPASLPDAQVEMAFGSPAPVEHEVLLAELFSDIIAKPKRSKAEEAENHSTLYPIKYTNALVAKSMEEIKDKINETFGHILNPSYEAKKADTTYVKCNVRAPKIDGFSSLPIESVSSCPWKALIKVASDGSVACLTPVYPPDFLAKAREFPGAQLLVDGRRISFPQKGDIPGFFISGCGHVHYADGRSSGGLPHALDLKAKEAIARTNGDMDASMRILRNDTGIADFSSRFESALRKHQANLAAKPGHYPMRSLESFEAALLADPRNIANPIAINDFPEADDGVAIFTCMWKDEVFAYACTRASAELSMKVGCLHIDATFNVIGKGWDKTDKLLTVGVQDAKRKIFLVGCMIAKSECVESYEAMFHLMTKSWKNISETYEGLLVRRFVFDGFHGLQDLVERVFSPEKFRHQFEFVFRASCFYHALASVRKYVKGNVAKKDNLGLPFLAVAIMHKICSSPSLAAARALWLNLRDILPELDPEVLSQAEREPFVSYFEAWYMNTSCELFGWPACADVRRLTPHGPVFSRSNNVIESLHGKMKRLVDKKSEADMANRERATVSLGSIIQNSDIKNFSETVDVLSFAAAVQLAIFREFCISKSISASGRVWPLRQSRVFLLCRETKILYGITEEERARSLVGQFVEEKERADYRDRERISFLEQWIDRKLLGKVMERMSIIMFHPGHLPGSKDSFTYAVCTCICGTQDAICQDVLAIHYHFFNEWRSQASPGETPPDDFRQDEYRKWPSSEAVLDYLKVDRKSRTGEGPEMSALFNSDESGASILFKDALPQRFAGLTCKTQDDYDRFQGNAISSYDLVAALVSDSVLTRSKTGRVPCGVSRKREEPSNPASGAVRGSKKLKVAELKEIAAKKSIRSLSLAISNQ
jgi:hypothetical protein